MGIIGELLGSGDKDVETVEQSEEVNPVSHVEEEPVHDWFSEDAYEVNEDLGAHSGSSAEYSDKLEDVSDASFDVLDMAEMSVSDEMRSLVRDSYRIVEVDNGSKSVKAAYLDWHDNIDEALSDLLGQATYRNEEGELTVDDFAVKRAVDMMYDEVESINQELREEGVDVIGGRRNSSVKASANASRYDGRSCMSNYSMIGWGEPGINCHIGFSVKNTDSDTLPVGSNNPETKKIIRNEACNRLDFYKRRAHDSEGTVGEIAQEFIEVFNDQEEVKVTVEQKHRTDSIDRIMMDDTQVYDGETFTYETNDSFRRSNRYDTGLREFDRIAAIVERDEVHKYQEEA